MEETFELHFKGKWGLPRVQKAERHIRKKKAFLLGLILERKKSYPGSDKRLGVRVVAPGEADYETSFMTREGHVFHLEGYKESKESSESQHDII